MRITISLFAVIASASAALAEPTTALPKSTVQSWPEITTHPLEPRELIGDSTQWYKVQTTAEPDDSLLIGLRNFTQDNGDVDTYYFECVNAPYTVISGYGGCGRDDLYTSCSSNVAAGIDGDRVICTKRGSICVTYSIFDDLDAATFTPFLGCGDRGTTNLELARTWTGSGVTQATESSESRSDTDPTTDSSEIQSSSTTDAQPTETNAGYKQGPTAYLHMLTGLLLAIALNG
ncbi:uncharacterized protein B0J16DRAFT_403799 [Fusarium flagelliforme]|uniref:uncharacterized protein n=1 Tax=Fusarium flagelliforme TaxID=2675880 RepID=UPI001E8EDFFA|nr:uncharacterized protein B0J16DRAFT_403799 [Fusarium flagelliforme]KAH7174214.1 hypothetical protein B0J16DRAFT_403799 [Fusarium flagelliforme]